MKQTFSAWQDDGASHLATSLFGATVVFAELQSALNQVWNVRLKKGFNIMCIICSRLISFVAVLIVGILLLLSVVLSTAIAAINSFFSDKIAIPAGLLVTLDIRFENGLFKHRWWLLEVGTQL